MSVTQEFFDLRPAGGFGLIMADPPWSYENFSAAGEGKNAKAHYGCMGLDALGALPVSLLAADNCMLWLWATNPMLPQALQVMALWGFQFKTAGTWVKRTVHGKLGFGTGYILRSANEPFLIGTRGSPRAARTVRSVVTSTEAVSVSAAAATADWPATAITVDAIAREHSRKPDAAFAAAEALMPHAARIELFSRESRPGWTCWGNEVTKFDDPNAIEAVRGILRIDEEPAPEVAPHNPS